MASLGDPRTGRVLFEQFEETVNRLVWRLLGADDAHDDIVQDVFVLLLRGLRKVREPAALANWVAKVTVNKVRSEIRRRSLLRRRYYHEPEAFELAEASPPPYEARELLRRTFEVIVQLPANERIAFTLRYIDQQPLEAIAVACDCSLATIKRRLQSAEARFARLAERDPDLKERLHRGAGG
ncbi:RNA polymerase sigma factor [Nannocystis pusilla]|uniref:RNA polymerase sigma factor n=1 Tax=Nannocystis pusilla TaxID=889268 RepID=UPI003BF3B8A8